MRLFLAVLAILFLSCNLALAQFQPPAEIEQNSYGRLTVYSDVTGVDIYVDGKFVGQDRATVSNIPAGKHYVRVAKGEENIQSGIVSVKEGEETIIVAKPSSDQLLSRIRKPTAVYFYGGLTDLTYNSVIGQGQPAPAGTYTYEYKPQLGFGAEVQFPIPLTNFRVDFGFAQNYPGTITISASEEGQLAVSTPYLNVSTGIIKSSWLKVNAGGGINYAIYSPGYRTAITIESRLGYQFFLEGVRTSGENQSYVLQLGYAIYNGKALGAVKNTSGTYTYFPVDINAPGFYVRAGAAYQL